MLVPDDIKKKIARRIEKLKQMDEEGSYEENIKAIEDLDTLLNDLGAINVLMQIQKAGELCETHEPSKASVFFRAIEDIMKALVELKQEDAKDQFLKIMPEVSAVIQKYDRKTGVIHKDIKR